MRWLIERETADGWEPFRVVGGESAEAAICMMTPYRAEGYRIRLAERHGRPDLVGVLQLVSAGRGMAKVSTSALARDDGTLLLASGRVVRPYSPYQLEAAILGAPEPEDPERWDGMS